MEEENQLVLYLEQKLCENCNPEFHASLVLSLLESGQPMTLDSMVNLKIALGAVMPESKQVQAARERISFQIDAHVSVMARWAASP